MYAKKAKDLFCKGYNCAQAVFCAFSDILGMDETTALKLSSSFGGGMGRLREVCGAVSGAFMVLGCLYGYDNAKDDTAKKEHYERIQQFAKEFKENNGSYICRELLGFEKIENSPHPTKRTNEFYEKRPCSELVYEAALMVEKYIEQNQ